LINNLHDRNDDYGDLSWDSRRGQTDLASEREGSNDA